MEDFTHIIANPRPKDDRDILLGAVQALVSIPATFLPDNSWLQRNFQGKTPYCGSHAGTHFKAIKEYNENKTVTRFTPRYGETYLKNPKSPVYDGFPIANGTTMTAIFKWLQKVGAASFEPLQNDVTLAPQTYCAPSAITPAMDSDASNHKILSYAFDALSFADLQQAIFQNKAVILLIHCDNGFWGTSTPTFTSTPYTHFICADGYDQNNLRIIDSAEPNDAYTVKMINSKYVTPQFFVESGTGLDVPYAQLQATVKTASQVVQQLPTAPISTPEKETVAQKVEDFIETVEQIL